MSARPTNIIRRQHTRFFTTITKTILDDERLALDEMALLVWLLSRPHDWEVIPSFCRKRFGIGRDKFYRIMTALCNAGYVKREKERAENGTITCIRYVVSDDPAIPVRRVEQGEIEAEGDVEGDESKGVTSLQHTENPDTGEPDTAKADAGINNDKKLNNPPTPQVVLGESPKAIEEGRGVEPSFKALLSKWPSDCVLSQSAAERRFLRLDGSRKQASIDGIANYLAEMRRKGWKVCDLQTYLRDRRWEKPATGVPLTCGYALKGFTPQAYRWLDHYGETGVATAYMRECLRTGKAYFVPSEWPPPKTDDRRGEPSERHRPPESNNSDISSLADEMEPIK